MNDIGPVRDDDTLPPDVVAELLAARRHRTIAVGDVGGASVQGRRRRRNEDAWGYRSGSAFVVVDGMGGRPAGDLAAAAALDALTTSLSGDVRDWREIVAAANRAVAEAAQVAKTARAGAVFVALRCMPDRLSLLHVGDARAFRLREGRPEALTRDHTIVEAMADVGLRRDDTAFGPRELGAVTGFLGDDDSWEEFTVRELSVRDGDRIVLTTDGVHEHVDVAAWRTAGALPAGGAAGALVDAAVAAGSPDDATALVVDLVVTTDGTVR